MYGRCSRCSRCSTLKGGCYATLQPQCRSNCYVNATLRYSATDKETWESIGSAALRVIGMCGTCHQKLLRHPTNYGDHSLATSDIG